MECITESSHLYDELAEVPCPVCGEDVGKLTPVKTHGQNLHQNDLEVSKSRSSYAPRGKKNRTGQEKKLREYGEDLIGTRLQSNMPNAFLALNDIYHKNPQEGRTGVGESAKLNAAVRYIKKWQADAPDDKIIGESFISKPMKPCVLTDGLQSSPNGWDLV